MKFRPNQKEVRTQPGTRNLPTNLRALRMARSVPTCSTLLVLWTWFRLRRPRRYWIWIIFFGIFWHVELHTFHDGSPNLDLSLQSPFFFGIKWDKLQNVNWYRIFCLSVCGIGLIDLGKFDVKKNRTSAFVPTETR